MSCRWTRSRRTRACRRSRSGSSLLGRYAIGPAWRLPVLELARLVPLTVAVPTRHARETAAHRAASLTLVAVVSAANVASLVLLVHSLLNGVQRAGAELFFAAMQI